MRRKNSEAPSLFDLAGLPKGGVHSSPRKFRAAVSAALSRGARRYEISPKNEIEKSAVYQIDAATIDVTDLLNYDFELFDMLEDALKQIVTTSTATSSAQEQLNSLLALLMQMFDKQSDRVTRLAARLSEFDESEAEIHQAHEAANPTISAQCSRLNRLGDRAQEIDYLHLYTGGQDDFSALSARELITMVRPAQWAEMKIRLRASAILNDKNIAAAARWILRGLEVRHAVQKVRIDVRHYENRKK